MGTFALGCPKCGTWWPRRIEPFVTRLERVANQASFGCPNCAGTFCQTGQLRLVVRPQDFGFSRMETKVRASTEEREERALVRFA